MSTRIRTALPTLALALGLASGAVAQGTPIKVKEAKKGMFKLAKVTSADAIKTAQAQFPSAKIKSGELEREDGKLVYTFDLQQPGVKGIEEINIDANTGTVIKTEHEDLVLSKKTAPKPPVKKPSTP
jgi:hypothetical protein